MLRLPLPSPKPHRAPRTLKPDKASRTVSILMCVLSLALLTFSKTQDSWSRLQQPRKTHRFLESTYLTKHLKQNREVPR